MTDSQSPTLTARLRDEAIERMLSQAFVSGQMDAQATAMEKFKVGSGGPLKALSRKAYAMAEAEAAALLAAGEATPQLTDTFHDPSVGNCPICNPTAHDAERQTKA